MACSISALFQLTVDKVLSLSFDLWKMIKKRPGPYRKNGTRQIIANAQPQYLLQTRRLFIAVQIVWIFICFSAFFSFVHIRTMCKLNSRFDLWPLTVRFCTLKNDRQMQSRVRLFQHIAAFEKSSFYCFQKNIHIYKFTHFHPDRIEILISD